MADETRAEPLRAAGTAFAHGDMVMTSDIDSALREQLHLIIGEVLAAASDNTGHISDDSSVRTGSLLARLHALRPLEPPAASPPQRLEIGDLVCDLAGHEILIHGRHVDLTHREFELFRFLAQRPGRTYTRKEIIAHVWADRRLMSERTVDIHIHRLRAKLGGAYGELVETVRQVGYKLRRSPVTFEELSALTNDACFDAGLQAELSPFVSAGSDLHPTGT